MADNPFTIRTKQNQAAKNPFTVRTEAAAASQNPFTARTEASNNPFTARTQQANSVTAPLDRGIDDAIEASKRTRQKVRIDKAEGVDKEEALFDRLTEISKEGLDPRMYPPEVRAKVQKIFESNPAYGRSPPGWPLDKQTNISVKGGKWAQVPDPVVNPKARPAPPPPVKSLLPDIANRSVEEIAEWRERQIAEWHRKKATKPVEQLRGEDRTPTEVILHEPNEGLSFGQKANFVLGAPFRAVGGLAKGTQESLQFLARNMGDVDREMFRQLSDRFRDDPIRLAEEIKKFYKAHPMKERVRDIVTALQEYTLDRAKKSITEEDPVHLADVNIAAGEALKGDHPLSPEQMTGAVVLGFAQDVVAAGPLFPGGVKKPMAPIVGKQMKRALDVASGKGGKVRAILNKLIDKDPAGFLKAGEWVAKQNTHPERLSAATRTVRNLAKKMGIDPKLAEAALLKEVGREGGALGLEGFRKIFNRGPTGPRPLPKDIAPGATTIDPVRIAQAVPPGAEAVGPRGTRIGESVREILANVKYGGGAAEGAVEALRPGLGIKAAWDYVGGKRSKALNRLFKAPGNRIVGDKVGGLLGRIFDKKGKFFGNRSEEFGRMRSGRSVVAEEGKAIKALEGDKAAIDVEKSWTEDALERLGLSREEIAGGYKWSPGRRGVRERQGMAGFSKHMAMLERDARAIGLKHGKIQEYIAAIQTKASKRKQLPGEVGPGEASGKPGFTRERIGGIGLGGTDSIEFEQRLDRVLALHTQAYGQAAMSLKVEGDIVGAFGRAIEPEWLHSGGKLKAPIRDAIHERGLSMHEPKWGPLEGQKFIIDNGVRKLLLKTTDPKSLDKVLKTLDKFSSWWKVRALGAPQWVERNTGANVIQSWLMDVDLVTANSNGAALLAQRAARDGVGLSDPVRSYLYRTLETFGGRKMFDKGKLFGEKRMLGKFTQEEALRGMEEWNILNSGGVMTEIGEAGGVGAKYSMNPLSKHFFPQTAVFNMNNIVENQLRASLWADSLVKGYEMPEAAARVAEGAYNYNEITRAVQAGRSLPFPFVVWATKTMNLVGKSFITRSRKMANVGRFLDAAQDLDAQTAEEYLQSRTEELMRARKGIVRIPFSDGDTFHLGNYSPLEVPNRWLSGVDASLVSLGELAHPIIDLTYKLIVDPKKKEPYPGYYGTFGRDPKKERTAPTILEGFMEAMRDVTPTGYNMFNGIIRPQYNQFVYHRNKKAALAAGMSQDEAWEYADKHSPILRYKVDAEVLNNLTQIDPQIGRVLRGTRRNDEQTKKELLALFAGIKIQEMSDRRVHANFVRDSTKAIKEVMEALGMTVKAGKAISDDRPLRGMHP